MTTKDAEEKAAASAEPPTSLEKAESMSWTEGQQGLQRSEVRSASAELQSGNQIQEACLDEERSRMDIKGKKKSKAWMLSQPPRAGLSLFTSHVILTLFQL